MKPLDPNTLPVAERSAWQNGYEEGKNAGLELAAKILDNRSNFSDSAERIATQIRTLRRE